MSGDPRETAIENLEQLRDCLRQDAGALSVLVDQTERLISAVGSSHMEAVRFQLFGLRRHLDSPSGSPTEDRARQLLEEAIEALQLAGFRTS